MLQAISSFTRTFSIVFCHQIKDKSPKWGLDIIHIRTLTLIKLPLAALLKWHESFHRHMVRREVEIWCPASLHQFLFSRNSIHTNIINRCGAVENVIHTLTHDLVVGSNIWLLALSQKKRFFIVDWMKHESILTYYHLIRICNNPKKKQEGQDGPGSLTWFYEIALANFFLSLSWTDQNFTNIFERGHLRNISMSWELVATYSVVLTD